ncbi:unnamed protein product [Oppiella nova]|uniref:RING-type domain-containing protein n=1 Tax=Oppiella nova TaxID=334625 RepID=A0A7R9LGU3_9ACAR|nr:unnamed protein product [Oppiella nova]CAG2163492.1 unnamed protein product [Oppiella nova]
MSRIALHLMVDKDKLLIKLEDENDPQLATSPDEEDKLLIKLEDENDPQLATSPDEECVICISAKATMQTYPCGHRVVCRKCFVKTIQMVVSQRMLPLRCVICRSKILRLKQTSHGGLNTGHVLRSARSYANTNPFYISPASSPVSPVTEVFREQRSVFVRHYVEFGYDPNGQSPVFSRSGGSNCVLHKHCIEKATKESTTDLDSNATSLPNTSSSSSHECGSKISGTPFQWHFNRKRKYSRSLHRRRGTKSGQRSNSSRPNSLLLPIDEREELQELFQTPNANDLTQTTESETSFSSSTENVETDHKCDTKSTTPSSSSLSSRLSRTFMRAKKWMKRDNIAHRQTQS